ncbi:MAG: DEAD/DEAH box helicase [Nodosilinea sp.]
MAKPNQTVVFTPEEVGAKLEERYQHLSETEQDILELLSVNYAPVPKKQLLTCLNTYWNEDKRSRPLTAKDLTAYLNRLIQQELVIMQGSHGSQCHPLLVEVVTRHAIRKNHFEAMVKTIEKVLPIPVRPWDRNQRLFQNQGQFLREVRIGLYRHNWAYIEQQFDAYYNNMFLASTGISIAQVFELVCNNPFDRQWFITLKTDPDLYEAALGTLSLNALLTLSPTGDIFAVLDEECRSANSDMSEYLQELWIQHLLVRGQLPQAATALEQLAKQDSEASLLLEGWLACLRGDYQQTIAIDTLALKQLRKKTGKRKIYFDTIAGIFLVLALIQQGTTASLQEAEEYAKLISNPRKNHWLNVTYTCLEKVSQVLQGNSQAKQYLTHTPVSSLDNATSFETLIDCLCLYWADLENARDRLPEILKDLYRAARAAGYDWFALEAAELMAQLTPESTYARQVPALRESTGIQPLVGLVTPKQPWELSLTALMGLNSGAAVEKAPASLADSRLAWFLTIYPTSGWLLQPKEQKLGAKGCWSRGRVISLRRLKGEAASLGYLTPQDLQICAHLVPDHYGYDNYRFQERALIALAGHPLVFWEDFPSVQVEVVKADPTLVVSQIGKDKIAISLNPEMQENKSLSLVKETPTRLKVIEFSTNHQRIAELLGSKNALEVPVAAKDQVLAAINAVAGLVTVHSDIGGGVADAETLEAQPQPHLHLLPAGEGLKVSLLTRPFGNDGPYYRPGSGGEMVIAEIQGKRFQTHRNLSQEKSLAQALEKSCGTLQRLQGDQGEWLIDQPEDCLELLLELQDLGDRVVVEWPEGEKMRIANRVSLNNFKVQIQRQQDWFQASGELQISDDQVMDMQHLLELLEATPGRFVKLADGQFLALTQEFRKRLEDLRTFSEPSGQGVRFHPLASMAMEEWIDEVGQIKTDKYWKNHIQRLKEAQNLQPKLPSTLQAELRDYQKEGFYWLARLAHWGVGACLADDMGLGKTLQALAVILSRAPQGPTLIIAPTSVGMNWLDEAERFAPTLRPIQLGSGDRQQVLDNLQPFDLLVCSYGLLQQDNVANKLVTIQWQTIVLDEAQAIKNSGTKRSKAAMKLQGNFKLITTGTPIENHLGELWNLFRFINPGLLGSQEQFSQKFANPIERQQDSQARNRLRKLIQPFILRRTKSQVLDELPARTEITLQVELSLEETAFYEALRRQAIAKLTETNAEAGAKHLQVLAEIMRLRRACCNTRLVNPEAPLPSAKLEAFGEILEDLLGNQHKALVFSQFVDHLTILREYLEGQQITYQYLDGSTPTKERKKRVDAFQSGSGDVFLISLKAGGTGLNLTAADYVIHMDPWWNPAVEDQASDRAHRMGQQRPVTIYRLVAKNTIEEKIVNLHRQKRDLADSLLEGADISGKVSTEELLKLISEGNS